MKRPDLFILLSTKLPRNPSIRHSGPGGELLFIRGLMWAKENGNTGWIHDFDLPAVAVGLDDVEESVKALVDEGLWAEGDGGWQIPSWKAWNDADEEQQKREQKNREAAAERKRKQREREREAAAKAAAESTEQAPAEPESSNVVTSNVTRDVTRDGGVTVTHVTELEIEKERDKEPSLRSGVQPPLLGVVEPATAPPPRPAESKRKQAKPKIASDEIADRIVDDWWERNKSTTAQSFVAVRSIIRPLIARELDPALVAAAMDSATAAGFPISGGTLTTALKRLQAPQDPYGNVTPLHQSPATRAASSAFERARRYAEEEGQSLADLFAKEA